MSLVTGVLDATETELIARYNAALAILQPLATAGADREQLVRSHPTELAQIEGIPARLRDIALDQASDQSIYVGFVAAATVTVPRAGSDTFSNPARSSSDTGQAGAGHTTGQNAALRDINSSSQISITSAVKLTALVY